MVALAVGLAAINSAGCGGSDPQQTKKAADAAKQEKEDLEKEKKPEFEFDRVKVQPEDADSPFGTVKPGHWQTAVQAVTKNHSSFAGSLEASVVDKKGDPIELAGTPFRLATSREVTLPEGQKRHLEVTLFAPHAGQRTRLATTMRSRSGGREVFADSEYFTGMPPYQYFLVVAARDPDRYGYIKVLDSVSAPWDDPGFLTSRCVHYRVVTTKVDARISIPSHPLAWTSTAYLVWDDIDPDTLSDDQEQAMLDWIHWGGRVIISGPDSIDSLSSSFLGPYLPARSQGTRQITDADLQTINDHWTLSGKEGAASPLVARRPWTGVALAPHPDARPIPTTGGLLVERKLGRGGIVISAFQLSERDLINWKGFDGFFNACLLRRERRIYAQSPITGETSLTWADHHNRQLDAQLITGVRFFSRDAGRNTRYSSPRGPGAMEGDGIQFSVPGINDNDTSRQLTLIPQEAAGGVASWNAFSQVANAARESLRKEAGIVVPKRSFVVAVLAAYLTLLVPLNWLFFRTMARVEWAWVAAPVIAVAFAITVIKLAQLDIGFARSQTEIAVLEVQGGYPRGHLTRYTALYTSLATSYDATFDDRTAVAQPFPVEEDFALLAGQTRTTVTYERHPQVRLTDVRASSNATVMLHSEQLLDLGGAVLLAETTGGPPQVDNQTELTFHNAIALRRAAGSESLEVCNIGELAPGRSVPLSFTTSSTRQIQALLNGMGSQPASTGALDVGPLLELATTLEWIEPGEIRLVGRVDTQLPGITIEPVASQIQSATVLVVHLTYGEWRKPRPDANMKSEAGIGAVVAPAGGES